MDVRCLEWLPKIVGDTPEVMITCLLDIFVPLVICSLAAHLLGSLMVTILPRVCSQKNSSLSSAPSQNQTTVKPSLRT